MNNYILVIAVVCLLVLCLIVRNLGNTLSDLKRSNKILAMRVQHLSAALYEIRYKDILKSEMFDIALSVKSNNPKTNYLDIARYLLDNHMDLVNKAIGKECYFLDKYSENDVRRLAEILYNKIENSLGKDI